MYFVIECAIDAGGLLNAMITREGACQQGVISVESSGIGLYLLPLYSETDQVVVKNSNILPKSSWSSQRLHNEDSEQMMYLIECLALDHG